jgi:hypothetical protein
LFGGLSVSVIEQPMSSVEVRPSQIHGLGVFATREFEAGQTVVVIDDSRVVDAEHPLRPDLGEYAHHCDYLAGGRVVLMPPPERHINSSCDPNTCVGWEGGRRRVVARRAIAMGEEITYDYIIDCHGGEVWQCGCGAARCRGTIVSSFFELPLEVQREYLPLLSPWFVDEHREAVDALRRRLGGEPPPN